ncbi:protein lifeguard 1 [Drosophila guanche]|uniref:Blast:Protein lifeguard 1 n=1 Tax=Drosophila guanche TaxID=7266 RepID=A0A3B0K469_DROGU|nr:protein lifeguard 1 [Drosophila guanche]SPP88083.1 blast:Protein lifeguard 1 [Drosophila guanche]
MQEASQPIQYGNLEGHGAELLPMGPYGSYGSGDPEGQPKNIGFNDDSIRRGFIRKVYLILMAQLVATFGAVSIFVFNDNVKMYALQNGWVFWLALLLMVATLLGLVCSESLRRQTPQNFIFLGGFTVAQSLLLGVSACRFASTEVLMAVGITAAVCLALTLFAMQTKYDFTMMGGLLITLLVILLIFGLVAVFVGGSMLITLIYASASALLFSMYLIYDTQLMMGGRHRYSISPEEYIFAALNLYLDIINIFLDILVIIGGSDN